MLFLVITAKDIVIKQSKRVSNIANGEDTRSAAPEPWYSIPVKKLFKSILITHNIKDNKDNNTQIKTGDLHIFPKLLWGLDSTL